MNKFIVETKNVKEVSEYHTYYFFLATSDHRMPRRSTSAAEGLHTSASDPLVAN